ncbi:hypothetical protein [Streptomyces sp. UH6]|uniref:hypothetical protein n=1 Tax=Streptomyces sp. UH6 TaxID=2748379 RepID=UPI0015D4D564|nr:hypothetical protein [Streptomyces sp. UH6]NYV73975.1 hypothetical protein [Streptomyces sp. UH6]
MGGEGWTHTGPYGPDLAAAFRQAQDEELARDDRGFPGRSVTELWREPEWIDRVLTGGTRTVLDFPLMLEAADPHDGPFLRPLTDAEVRAWAPGGRPTHEEWAAALGSGRLAFPARGQGNCTVLFHDGVPVAIGYWGVTSD